MELFQSDPFLVVWLAVLGLSVGFLTGLFGIGGAFVTTPIMISLGIDSSTAVGCSMGMTLFNGIMGLRRHRGLGNFEPKAMWPIAIAACAGTFVGWWYHQELKQACGEENFGTVVNGLFCVILIPIGLVVWWQSGKAEGKPLLARFQIPVMVRLNQPNFPPISATLLALVGLSIGVAKGMLGIGGGIILLPVLVLAVGLTPHRAVGVSLGVVVLSSILGTSLYAFSGNINVLVIAALLIGSLVGVVLGAKFCNVTSAVRLKRMLAMLLLGFSI